MEVRKYSNESLVEKLFELRVKERKVTLEVLELLTEMDRRKHYRELGYPSLFEFAVKHLGYSESGAGRRIAAARCIAENPKLIDMYETGELSLSSISLVAGTLRKAKERKEELVEQIRGASSREVLKIVAKEAPQKRLRESVKPVFVSTPNAESAPRSVDERYELRFSVSPMCRKKLERAAALLSHTTAGAGELEKVFERLLDEYLEKKSPEKRAQKRAWKKTRKNQKPTSSKTHSRHVPAKMRDEVHLRDGGRCCYTSKDGTRCSATKFLQVDHIQPYSLGGSHEPENLRLLCSAHNQLEAERVFGRAAIEAIRGASG